MKSHSFMLHKPVYTFNSGYPRLHAPYPLPRCRAAAVRMPLHWLPQYLLAQAGRWWR